MAFDPLATVADLPETWSRNFDAPRALDIASAAIRDAAESPISQVTGTINVTGSHGRLLRLPQPIVAVTAVAIDASPVTDWKLIAEGLWRTDHCWHPGLHAHQHGWIDPLGDPASVSVTGTFGPATVPADIVDMCAQLAAAWLQHQAEGGGSTAGVTSVGIDDARETYSSEAAGQVSPVFIPEITRDWLRTRFGTSSAVVVETL